MVIGSGCGGQYSFMGYQGRASSRWEAGLAPNVSTYQQAHSLPVLVWNTVHEAIHAKSCSEESYWPLYAISHRLDTWNICDLLKFDYSESSQRIGN